MVKIHLDTDIGGDMDDLCALAMLLNWEEAELLAVTSVDDNAGKRAGYARYALRLAGREDIPVAAGADASLDCYRHYAGLPDEAAYWPEPVAADPPALEMALDLLAASTEQGALIAAVGPYTNLALLEKRSPGILRRANLALMGGFIYPPRAGYPAWGIEMDWNVQQDVGSALIVLEQADPLVVPLAMTVETVLRRTYLTRLRNSGPLARLIARQAEAFARDNDNETKIGQTCPGLPADIINFQHDPLACAIALGWREGVTIDEIPLVTEIQEGWLHQRIDVRGKPTRVVTQVDGDAFSEFWVDLVTRKD